MMPATGTSRLLKEIEALKMEYQLIDTDFKTNPFISKKDVLALVAASERRTQEAVKLLEDAELSVIALEKLAGKSDKDGDSVANKNILEALALLNPKEYEAE